MTTTTRTYNEPRKRERIYGVTMSPKSRNDHDDVCEAVRDLLRDQTGKPAGVDRCFLVDTGGDQLDEVRPDVAGCIVRRPRERSADGLDIWVEVISASDTRKRRADRQAYAHQWFPMCREFWEVTIDFESLTGTVSCLVRADAAWQPVDASPAMKGKAVRIEFSHDAGEWLAWTDS